MANDQVLLDIMENTISIIKGNKDSVISIIKNLQDEHEKKTNELMYIKSQLPKHFTRVQFLRALDKKLRSDLANASSDFSASGRENLHIIFEKANKAHTEFLQAEEAEKSYIRRRNELELDLKNSLFNIQQAEFMAQQLLVSLSYLQTGMNQLNASIQEKEQAPSDTSLLHFRTFFECLENEKLRIARDLHDGPVQHIASLQMRVDFCKMVIQRDLEQGLNVLDQLKDALANTLNEVRDILFDLNPAPLEKIGLKRSIEHMLYNILDNNKIYISFSYNVVTQDIPLFLQTTIYRVVQELINNIKKHAYATHVSIRIFEMNHFIYIHLEDNGVGFDIPNDFESFYAQNKSYGILNISTRIRELKGSFKMNSTKHKGSLFRVQLPIQSI